MDAFLQGRQSLKILGQSKNRSFNMDPYNVCFFFFMIHIKDPSPINSRSIIYNVFFWGGWYIL